MTRTKAWRLSLSFILMFGWLFLTPAHSNDPLSVAAEEISELNKKVANLTEEADTKASIDVAEDKYDVAVAAKSARDTAYQQYDAAVTAEATALSEKTTAQVAVDGQTVTVATALTNKNNAQDALDIANINLSTAQQALGGGAGGKGLAYDVYSLIRVNGQATTDQFLCSGIFGEYGENSMQRPVCGNRYENFIVKFTGKITVPSWFTTTKFAGYTDDGFRMYVDGNLAIDNWVEQGVTWSPYSPIYDVSVDKTLDVEIWWYNGGGVGSFHLGWGILYSGDSLGWTGVGCDFAGNPRVWGENFSCTLNTLSHGSGATQEQTNAYNSALAAKNSAQTVYNDKLSVYNSANSTLTTYNQTLTNKTTAYNNAVTYTSNKLTAKNNTQSAYDQSIINLNNALDNAWDLYDKTFQFEERQRVAAAIAAAIANQPRPEPKPEPTKPVEPKPTLEPKPEPKPEIKPEPNPETKPLPIPRPDFKPSENIDPVIKDQVLAALVPEKGTGRPEDLSGVIANLTSKDNKLVKLSPEQTAAVSQTLRALDPSAKREVAKGLGISSSEIEKVALAMKSDRTVAAAFVEFEERSNEAGNAVMPFTLADATTEVATETFLSDPLAAISDINFEELLDPSEWGKDMTDDQREKAQEVVVPVIIAGNIVAAAMTRRI